MYYVHWSCREPAVHIYEKKAVDHFLQCWVQSTSYAMIWKEMKTSLYSNQWFRWKMSLCKVSSGIVWLVLLLRHRFLARNYGFLPHPYGIRGSLWWPSEQFRTGRGFFIQTSSIQIWMETWSSHACWSLWSCRPWITKILKLRRPERGRPCKISSRFALEACNLVTRYATACSERRPTSLKYWMSMASQRLGVRRAAISMVKVEVDSIEVAKINLGIHGSATISRAIEHFVRIQLLNY